MLLRAIRLIAQGDGLQVEVNVSAESLEDPEFTLLLEQELVAATIDPSCLVFEVTGDAAVAHLDAARSFAKRVKALGCRFALDDFRSTFGSLRLLKELPLDLLKLDGELVGSLSESRTSQLIVKALVDVARGTGTETVAVFVSDDETIQLLRQHGVDYAQGYRVGRPKPVSEVWPDGQAALPPGDGD